MTKNEIIEVFLKEANSKERKYSQCTINSYLQYINKYLDSLDCEVNKTTEREVRMFLSNYDDKSEKTYNAVISALKCLYDILECSYLVDEDYITKNPMRRIKGIRKPKSKVKVPLTREEQMEMLRNTKNSRDYAILTTLIETGLRVHELIALTLKQYQNRDKENYGRIKLEINKGSYDDEYIYINEKCEKAIERYLLDRKESDCDRLFVSNYGNEMSESCLTRTFKTIARRCEFEEDRVSQISNHLCRATFASNMVNEGKDLDIVAKALRHHGLGTVMKYAKTDDSRVAMAFCGYGRRFDF